MLHHHLVNDEEMCDAQNQDHRGRLVSRARLAGGPARRSRRWSTPPGSSSTPRSRPGSTWSATASSTASTSTIPQTNGMIEYFVQADGRRCSQRFSFEELIAYRASSGMRFRTRPPGPVDRPDRARQPRPAARLRARQGAGHADLQVHRHRAAHAGQDVDRPSLQGHRRRSAHAHGRRAGASRSALSRPTSSRSTRPTCPATPTNGSGRRRRSTACSTRCTDHAGGAPVLRQLRRADGAAGHLGQADATT